MRGQCARETPHSGEGEAAGGVNVKGRPLMAARREMRVGEACGWKRGAVGGGYNVPAPNGGADRTGETLSKRLPEGQCRRYRDRRGPKVAWGRGPQVSATHPERLRAQGYEKGEEVVSGWRKGKQDTGWRAKKRKRQ